MCDRCARLYWQSAQFAKRMQLSLAAGRTGDVRAILAGQQAWLESELDDIERAGRQSLEGRAAGRPQQHFREKLHDVT